MTVIDMPIMSEPIDPVFTDFLYHQFLGQKSSGGKGNFGVKLFVWKPIVFKSLEGPLLYIISRKFRKNTNVKQYKADEFRTDSEFLNLSKWLRAHLLGHSFSESSGGMLNECPCHIFRNFLSCLNPSIPYFLKWVASAPALSFTFRKFRGQKLKVQILSHFCTDYAVHTQNTLSVPKPKI